MAASSRARLLATVFPPPTSKSFPTPTATPLIPQGSFGGGATSSFSDAAASQDDVAAESIQFERAWHHATELLSIRNAAVTLEDTRLNGDAVERKWIKGASRTARDGLAFVLERRGQKGVEGEREDLMKWYAQEIGRHYTELQLGVLIKILAREEAEKALGALLRVVRVVQFVYVVPFERHVASRLPLYQGRIELQRLKDMLHAMFRTSLSGTYYSQLSRELLKEWSSIVFRTQSEPEPADPNVMEEEADGGKLAGLAITSEEARAKTISLMTAMDQVGLGGSEAQRVFAEVMSEVMVDYVEKIHAGEWTAPSNAPASIRKWIEDDFSRYVIDTVSCLTGGQDEESPSSRITPEDIVNWQQRIIGDLGSLRLKELFDVVVDWDNGSRGAIEDLKRCITSTSSRAHLVLYFSQVVSQRLLQPGASTTEILQIYICIIRAFAVLDPKGVLLDRLARPIRRYLRERDDTIKVIVTGLLSDPEEDTNPPDALVELAAELNSVVENAGDDQEGELDFDDMSWVPDPVDAGPEYKKSKSTDVIETLISLFETKDVFVKEFQNILGERLLKPDCEFEKEERVLELLKLRFGESALQACEVMMRDVTESVRTDAWIKREQGLLDRQHVNISARILSRLYWPALHEETFRLPPELQALQERYARGFERFKTSRKLTWLDALGQAEVELELQDRTVKESVSTAHASVIYAFQDEDAAQGPVSKTAEQLAEELEMDEDLLNAALAFWVGKLVLVKSVDSGHYSVLERLPASDPHETLSGSTAGKPSEPTLASAAASAAAAAATSSAVSAVRSEEDIAEEKMAVFWQFIVGMLTNQGQMPLQRIVMMLGMAVPGGFPYSSEELKRFLGRKAEEGRVEVVGGNYRIVKGR